MSYSLHEFALHGGLIHRNKSGWGIAYFGDRDALLVKEPEPASDSPLARFVAEQERKSRCVIAHVRYATKGEPKLRNTHPFRRVLGRRVHVFAHNGTLGGLHEDLAGRTRRYQPVGETDSELAFCLLLEMMLPLWSRKDGAVPDPLNRLSVFVEFAAAMRKRGPSNFLYSDGEILFAHAHKRVYEENGEFSEPRPPGLSILNYGASREGLHYERDGLRIRLGHPCATLLASVPLDERGWEALPEGTALAISSGMEVGRMAT